jgi:hypothetical protein
MSASRPHYEGAGAVQATPAVLGRGVATERDVRAPSAPPPSNASANVTPSGQSHKRDAEWSAESSARLRRVNIWVKRLRRSDKYRGQYEALRHEQRALENKRREWCNALQREHRARRRRPRPPGRCAVCGTAFEGKRQDAKHCSATCRQRAHRSPWWGADA